MSVSYTHLDVYKRQILPLASVKTPSFKTNSKVPEFLQELSFKDGVAAQEAEEEVLEAAEEDDFTELVVAAVVVATEEAAEEA